MALDKQKYLSFFSRVVCHRGEDEHLKAFWPMGIQR